MDVGTSLVQAYLHVNGYFTATDYPLVEPVHDGMPRMLTDLDVMAVRFVHSQGHTESQPPAKAHGPVIVKVDPVLQSPNNRTDMIVAEVKQGRAQVNAGSRNRHALAAALTRFGCCNADDGPRVVHTLLNTGRAQTPSGHRVRMVLFASHGDRAPSGWHWIRLGHVFKFLNDYLLTEHDALGTLDLHDPALGWLSLLHKCNLTLQPMGANS